MKTLAFFNHRGGVGKTTTVYHLSWMLAELGYKVLAVDLDPQSDLSSMFLDRGRLEEIVLEPEKKQTLFDAIEPVIEGGIYTPVHIERISEHISLLIGNLSLSTLEEKFSDAWTQCLAGDPFGFKVTTLFKPMFIDAAHRSGAEWILIDMGANLGAFNRAILVNIDYLVVPVAFDFFSLQSTKDIGKTLREWRLQWEKRLEAYPDSHESNDLLRRLMIPIGYVLIQKTARDGRPLRSTRNWAKSIPDAYEKFVLDSVRQDHMNIDDDENCLALLRHFPSLITMSVEEKKPMFLLKPADGAIGAHIQGVRTVYEDFRKLAEKVINACQSAS
jgi:cellulose biosynthesis protein BcsQ